MGYRKSYRKTENMIKSVIGDYDSVHDDYLELVHKKNLENEKDIIFVSTINEKKDGSFLIIDNLFQYRKKNKEELIRKQIIGIMPWGPCSKVAKTEIVKKCKFSELDVGEEAIYSFDLLEKSNNIDFIEKPLYHYVHNESGQHTKGGYDPWWNVVKNMEKKLLEIKKISKYQKSLNGLALKSLSIAIYRYACNKKYKDAKKSIKETINKYRSKYKINYIEIKEISKSLIMILSVECSISCPPIAILFVKPKLLSCAQYRLCHHNCPFVGCHIMHADKCTAFHNAHNSCCKRSFQPFINRKIQCKTNNGFFRCSK